MLIIGDSQAVKANMQVFVHGLFELAQDPDDSVRKNVCKALVLQLESHPETIIPNLPNIVGFMLQMTNPAALMLTRQPPPSSQAELVAATEAIEAIALEACDFWLVLADQNENQVCKDILGQSLAQLLPILLSCMKYSDNEITACRSNEDDWNVVDKESDIKPRMSHAKSKNQGTHTQSYSGTHTLTPSLTPFP